MNVVRRVDQRGGFTLIEVILAIGITIGLMWIVLFFYQQASRLRRDALVQLEEVTAARLLLERLTRELRAARPDPVLLLGLKGSSNSIEFVCAGLALPREWESREGLPPVPLASDLNIIRYELAFGADTTNATGIVRAEEGLLELPSTIGAPGTTTQPVPRPGLVVTERLRHLQLRYWDGTEWVESWGAVALPGGVEITLAATAPDLETDEVFRRVIYLPGSEQAPDLPVLSGLFESEEPVP